jgi:hypothetical protein
LQIIALAWMAVLYTIKAVQLSRLPMPWEQAPARGSRAAGARRSYAGIFMPWTRESSRKHLWRWFEFGAYHVGAAVAILITFTLPFAPGTMTRTVSVVCAVLEQDHHNDDGPAHPPASAASGGSHHPVIAHRRLTPMDTTETIEASDSPIREKPGAFVPPGRYR